MKFEEALAAMRGGQTATRPSWRSFRGSYGIRFDAAQTDVVRVASSGADSAWQPTAADVAATDWAIVA